MTSQPPTGLEVAIIGMAGRFPGAPNIDAFWHNLRHGVESVSFFGDGEPAAALQQTAQPDASGHVKAGGILDDIESFDAEFFGFTPTEAEVTDPQHRLFLECAWEALEHSGYSQSGYGGDVGVYASAGPNTYLLNNLCRNGEFLARIGELQVIIGNDKDYIATRVSYKLDLRGPSVAVQSACSSSLVAVHMACQGLLNGECNMALAGGVSLSVPQKSGYAYQQGGITSPDGHCRAFDAQAQGTVKGSGAGVIVLKRLADAVEHGDSIHAVIRGSAINNDGSAKAGYTAPSVDGQARAIRAALALADVPAHTVTYVEAHGTATALGDPIEIAALGQAFGACADAKGFCAVGSVKTNIGHLDAAAGIAGIIKTALALKHGLIPPSLHYRRPNPEIDFESSPFYVNAELSKWKQGDTPRRAGVSSFGIGGSNAHVVLEEAPTIDVTPQREFPLLLLLSARSKTALESTTERLADHLRTHTELDLADVCYTQQVGRQRFRHRRFAVARTVAEAAEALTTRDPARVFDAVHGSPGRGVAFMFPGQGAQHPRMMAGVYEHAPAFRDHLDACCTRLKPHLGFDLRDVLYPRKTDADASARLSQTLVCQPALFAVEYSLACLWMDWGVEPQAMIGHSLGEYVAACLAGVFTLDDALSLVAARGRLMQGLPAGSMLAVPLPEAEVLPLLSDGLALAAVNRPLQCVVSGPTDAVVRLEARLNRRGLACQRVSASHAFHSAMVEPVLEAFLAEAGSITLQVPRIPYMSNVTGTWIRPAQAVDPGYWAQHLRETVRFADGVGALLEGGDRILLEVGPGQTLTSAVRRQATSRDLSLTRASLPRAQALECDFRHLLATAGHLWSAGVELDWAEFSPPPRRRVPLPTYPFERHRYWIEPLGDLAAPARGEPRQPAGSGANVQEESVPHSAPLPAHARPAMGTAYAAPRTEAERRITELWQEAFGIGQIGIHDNFFELGGDSILSLQITFLATRRNLLLTPSQFLLHPTIAELAAESDALTAGSAGESAPHEELPAVVPAPKQRYAPFPLTDVQHAYWIGRSGVLGLGNIASHVYQEFESNALDPLRLERALNALVARHAALRAVTTPEGEQRVLESVPYYRIEATDLRALAGPEAAARLAATREEMSHQVLPSERWPLFDVRASLLDGGRVRLHLSFDILFIDAWSLVLAGRELLRLYDDPESAFPPPELSFRDYVLAVSAFRDSEAYRLARDYWLRRVPQLPGAPALPLAKPAAPVAATRFVRRAARLDTDRWARLKARGGQMGLTPPMLLCAAFAEVLAAWSASPRFCINLPLFNRLPLHEEVNAVLGDFTSVVLLEVDNDAGDCFEARAARVQSQLWNDLGHRHFSGVEVMREIARTEPLRAIMPVVFTSLILPDADGGSLDAAAALGEEIFSISQTPQVWLDHQVFEDRGSLAFNWDTVDARFPAGLVQEMFDAYLCLLSALVDDEEAWRDRRGIARLLPVTQERLYASVNATEAPVSSALLHTLFAEQASRNHSHPAVACAAGTLTYGELARRARQVARCLPRMDARPGSLVAIVMEKGWEQVAAALGILYAGAAYVPVDPGLPPERLQSLLAHAEVTLVLTQPWLDQALAWPPGVRRIPVGAEQLAGLEDGSLEPVQQPGDLAYVIYTSGTTGEPKGVMIDHRGAVNTILDVNRRFGIGSGDRVLALSALSFDLSVYDIFGILAAGGTIIFPDPAASRDPAHWAELVRREGVTVWNSVPALMEMATQREAPLADARMDTLRLVLLSGDWIPVGLPQRIRASAPGARVISLGGATEASIWSVLYPIGAVDSDWASIPYGRPMTNQRCYILDERFEPRPAWAAGALYLGGIGLAMGYWRNPDETRSRFVEHPRTGERLYRTGDLARLLPDGNLELLGREDFQIKLNGHRIEPGEIEAALSQHPAVRGCVAATADTPHGRRLVAWVVGGTAPLPPAGELRRFLAERLPEYMVPSEFVVLHELPLTPNGKVDRRALPVPERGPAGDREAPRTPTEEVLAALWGEVLGVEPPGREDGFFELGGDSLSATRLILRVRATFRAAVPLRAVFASPTVAGLAAEIDDAREAVSSAPPLPVRPAPRDVPLPLSCAQRRLWFFDLLSPGDSTYNVQEAVRLTGALDVPALECALGEIVRRHEILRTTIREVNGAPAQVVAPHLNVRIGRVDLRGVSAQAREAEVRKVVADEAAFPFALSRGPLLRVILLRLGQSEHVLLLTMHHIVCDAWSTAIMVREIGILYPAFSNGHPSPLEELAVQYGDFAAWEAEELLRPAMQEHLAYWRGQLGETAPVLALPVDFPDAVARPNNGRRHAFVLPTDLRAALGELCRRRAVTLYMALLAAWQTLLHYYSGQEDILVGSPTANRGEPEAEHLIGFFVNTLVLRTRLSGNPTFAEVMERVREVALEAYAHQALPFDRLVEDFWSERREGDRRPLFRVWLVLQNVPIPPLALPGITVEPVEANTLMAVHDLKLSVVEHPDGLHCALDYREHLFAPATIARMAALFEALLNSVVASADTRLGALVTTLAAREAELREHQEREQVSVRLDRLKFAQRQVTRAEAG